MSALPASLPPDAPAGRWGSDDHDRRVRALRLVPDVPNVPGTDDTTRRASAGRGRSLAPVDAAQAWRRRAGLSLVGVFLVVAAIGAAGTGTATDGGAAVPVVPIADVTVVVQPGMTLWDVAGDHAPDGVARSTYVQMIVDANGLDGADVGAWQVVRLPAG